eukprot:3320665-Prymnesium_polylepis.1
MYDFAVICTKSRTPTSCDVTIERNVARGGVFESCLNSNLNPSEIGRVVQYMPRPCTALGLQWRAWIAKTL